MDVLKDTALKKNEKKQRTGDIIWNEINNQTGFVDKVKNGTEPFFFDAALFDDVAREIPGLKASSAQARLNTKYDFKNIRPSILKENNLCVFAVKNGRYGVFDAEGYETVLEDDIAKRDIKECIIPWHARPFCDAEGLSSESDVISALEISGAFEEFLGTNGLIGMGTGRERTNSFSFDIGKYKNVEISGVQSEADMKLESESLYVLGEAKVSSGDFHSDFMIRQIYFPYRNLLIEEEKRGIKIPVTNLFIDYSMSSRICQLIQYEFTDMNAYNSIREVKRGYFKFRNEERKD